jgi:chromosome partitioning protein
MVAGTIMKPLKPMKVVALAATKGGVGKTTLASALAVRASQESGRVALIDGDAQASLAAWYELRGEPDNPKLFDMDISAEGIGLLMAQGWEWAFIDTPPAIIDLIEVAILNATFVLIPTRASPVDIEAVGEVVDLCKTHRKPFAFVLNAVSPQWANLADGSEAYLRGHGPVLKERVGLRKGYVTAMTSGKSGAEVDKTAREEIDALWSAVRRAIAKSVRA